MTVPPLTPRLALALVAAAALSLLRCGSSSDSPASSPATADRDGDGVTAAAGDCNDQDPAIHPNATVVAPSCLWRTTQWDCPRGSERTPEDQDAIFVRVANNRCSPLSVVDATVHVTVLEAHGTFNHANEKWTSEHVLFSPRSLPAGATAEVEVDGDVVCTNRGGGLTFNVYQAEVVLQTSAAPLRCVTANTHTTRFPLAGATPGGQGFAGGEPKAARAAGTDPRSAAPAHVAVGRRAVRRGSL